MNSFLSSWHSNKLLLCYVIIAITSGSASHMQNKHSTILKPLLFVVQALMHFATDFDVNRFQWLCNERSHTGTNIHCGYIPASCTYWNSPVRRSSVLCSLLNGSLFSMGAGIWGSASEACTCKFPCFWRYPLSSSCRRTKQFKCSWPQKTFKNHMKKFSGFKIQTFQEDNWAQSYLNEHKTAIMLSLITDNN